MATPRRHLYVGHGVSMVIREQRMEVELHRLRTCAQTFLLMQLGGAAVMRNPPTFQAVSKAVRAGTPAQAAVEGAPDVLRGLQSTTHVLGSYQFERCLVKYPQWSAQ